MGEIIQIPFGYILDYLYQFTTNYGVALILFAIIVRVVLLPVNAKSRKSMMKMSRLQPRMQEIKAKYANDQQKQNEAIQKLQQEEGATMGCGGCLWSLVPLLIMLPLYQVIRQPIVYMLHESAEVADVIVATVKTAMPDLFQGNEYYHQIFALQHIAGLKDEILAALADKGLELQNAAGTLGGFNFTFLGIDLGQIPNWQVWNWKGDLWPNLGAALIPILSGGSQMLNMWLSQKGNNSVITNKDGVHDAETAKAAESTQQNMMMMWMMPLMSLWFGFSVPAALSLYWFVGGAVSMIENHFMTKHYRKVYDAEDALRLQKAMERDAEEAEKERIRAEKRAANPEGITANTSKKKLQQQKQAETAAAKAAAAKEYAIKHGAEIEEDEGEEVMSGIADRPFCKGRAYDPDRYSTNHSEE